MPKKLLNELSASLGYLSPVEKKIASVILNDPKRFTSYTMEEVASIAEVSHGSIINFSKKFASGGFPALKLRIAEGLSDFNEPSFDDVMKSRNDSALLRKNCENIISALRNTALLNDEKSLIQASEMILSAKRTEIFGVFSSALVAENLQFQLLQLGIPSSFVPDMLSSAISASMLDCDCVAIAISISGRTKEVIDAVKSAKEQGTPVICLTSNKNSPLAKLADLVLSASSSGKNIVEAQNESHFSLLLLANALCAYLRTRTDALSEEKYIKLRKILSSHSVED